MGIKTGTPTTEANGGKATPGGNSGTGEVPTAPTGPTQAETDAAQNATSQSTQFVSGSGARLGDGQLTPNRGFDAGSSTDAGSSQGASQDDDWRNAPPMGVTADNRIEPNQVLDEATRQVEGDWEFYDRAGEVIFFVATTVFTGGAAWFGRGAVVGKTGAEATARGGAPVLRSVGAAAAPGYRSFSAFKAAHGAAGSGRQWHHIVEQTSSNLSRFGAQSIHTRPNLVRLPTGIHQQISAFYSSVRPFTNGQTVRNWLSGQTFQAQQDFGREIVRQFASGVKDCDDYNRPHRRIRCCSDGARRRN